MAKVRWLLALATTATLLAACTGVAEPLPEIPSTLALRPTAPTTRRQNVARLSIPPLVGSTTTTPISFADGTVTLTGLVTGPDGPIPGATVVFERVVGEQTAVLRVLADADGRYKSARIKGGIVRVSAYRIPDVATAQTKVVFAADTTEVNLSVEKFSGTDVQWALGPAQPYVGRSSNLVIRVSVKRVDPDGVVRFAPLEGIGVRIVPLDALQPAGATERLTDAAGLASFQMACPRVGGSGVNVFLATGEETKIGPRSCSVPPTTAPPTTEPPVDPGDPNSVGNPDGVNPDSPNSTRRLVRRTTTIDPGVNVTQPELVPTSLG